MKNTTLILIQFISFLSFGQFEIDRFELLLQDVEELRLSRNEYLKYTYEDGKIIEEDFSIPLEGKIVRNYYFTHIGKLDSIVYFEIYQDTTLRSVEYYHYTKKGKLNKITFGENLKQEIIRIDSFSYDEFGRKNIKYNITNRKETIFGTKRIDSLKLYSKTQFFYDNKSHLVKEISNSFLEPDSIIYTYNSSDKLESKIEFHGNLRNGCFVKESKSLSITNYSFNKNGLIKKVKDSRYHELPNGKIKKVDSFTLRRKYVYY